jgi:hypothetical protein
MTATERYNNAFAVLLHIHASIRIRRGRAEYAAPTARARVYFLVTGL